MLIILYKARRTIHLRLKNDATQLKNCMIPIANASNIDNPPKTNPVPRIQGFGLFCFNGYGTKLR